MNTEKIIFSYKLINEAKITKMEDGDKFKLIKAIRVLKPIVTSFEDFVKDAQEKLKDDNFEEMKSKASKWQEDGDKSTLSMEERKEVNSYFSEYYKKVNDCIKEEGDKEHEVTFEKLSEDAFGKFISSNDFKVDDIMKIEEVICKPS